MSASTVDLTKSIIGAGEACRFAGVEEPRSQATREMKGAARQVSKLRLAPALLKSVSLTILILCGALVFGMGTYLVLDGVYEARENFKGTSTHVKSGENHFNFLMAPSID